nr:MAG TPA: hypothetical protein [Caudoviricetes sp.]
MASRMYNPRQKRRLRRFPASTARPQKRLQS